MHSEEDPPKQVWQRAEHRRQKKEDSKVPSGQEGTQIAPSSRNPNWQTHRPPVTSRYPGVQSEQD